MKKTKEMQSQYSSFVQKQFLFVLEEQQQQPSGYHYDVYVNTVYSNYSNYSNSGKGKK